MRTVMKVAGTLILFAALLGACSEKPAPSNETAATEPATPVAAPTAKPASALSYEQVVGCVAVLAVAKSVDKSDADHEAGYRYYIKQLNVLDIPVDKKKADVGAAMNALADRISALPEDKVSFEMHKELTVCKFDGAKVNPKTGKVEYPE